MPKAKLFKNNRVCWGNFFLAFGSANHRIAESRPESRNINVMRMFIGRMTLCAIIGTAILSGMACKKSDGRLKVYPTKGQILIHGNPEKDVLIYLWPSGTRDKQLHAYCPNGQTDENGNFTLSTYDSNDGAPEGDYTVTLEWPIRFNTLTNQWEGDRLKGAYSNQASSQLQAKIEAKPNELPIIRVEKK